MKFHIQSNEPPTVEIGSTSRSAYVRFRRAKIAKTTPLPGGGIVNVDLDKDGRVIGIEFLGVREFNISLLLKRAPTVQADVPIDRARYVAAKTVDMAYA